MLTQDVLHIVLSKMEALDCAHSLTVAILVRYERWEDLATLSVDPASFISAGDYLKAAQAVAFLKKARFLPTDREAAESRARAKWLECERMCYTTNRRLTSLSYGFTAGNRELDAYVRRCQVKMRDLLGVCPRPEDLTPRFGPGATVSDRSTLSTVPDKMSSQVTLTWSAVPWLTSFGRSAWGRAPRTLDCKIVRGDIYFTVDKDARTRRSCGKMPSLNVALQLPVGKLMRGRLRRVGIDLDDGQATHRELARAGSIRGHLATIDLSSASDCIAESAVRLMLPPAWFECLDRLRTRLTEVDGKWHWLEKFASMGNGFTFELETAMFLVMICAIAPDALRPGETVWVYGDDIIVPTEWSEAVLWALKWWGFSPNRAKTFTSGEFRESCGGDFFRGMDVRPFYWKESISEPARLITLANGIRRYLVKDLVAGTPEAARLRKVWFGVLDCIPSHIRACRGPEALGDLVVHDLIGKWDTKVRNSIRYVRAWAPAEYSQVFLNRFHPDVVWASLLYGVETMGDHQIDESRYVVPRDGVRGYKRTWVPFS